MVDVTIVTQLEGALSEDWTNSMFVNMVTEIEYKNEYSMFMNMVAEIEYKY